jgi:hypothetical protein
MGRKHVTEQHTFYEIHSNQELKYHVQISN